MPKMKAKKVATPGSTPVSASKASRGRPKKTRECVNKQRGPYMKKYNLAARAEAMEAIESQRMTVRETSKHFKITQAWLISI